MATLGLPTLHQMTVGGCGGEANTVTTSVVESKYVVYEGYLTRQRGGTGSTGVVSQLLIEARRVVRCPRHGDVRLAHRLDSSEEVPARVMINDR